MTAKPSFHSLAEEELNEAAAYYDREVPGLGSRFLDEVERALTSISRFPEAAPALRDQVRAKPLDRFPYSLLYILRASGIRILAVAHQRRRPWYWRGRS